MLPAGQFLNSALDYIGEFSHIFIFVWFGIRLATACVHMLSRIFAFFRRRRIHKGRPASKGMSLGMHRLV